MSGRPVRVEVRYPLRDGRMLLRTSLDWDRDLPPVAVDRAGGRYRFELELERDAFVYFKPLIDTGSEPRWSRGEDYLLLSAGDRPLVIHPFFTDDAGCSVCELAERRSEESGRSHGFRVFLPPGYHENTAERLPVIYMQDGQNLFFGEEAFAGRHWRVAETLDLLTSMNLVQRAIVVGVHPAARETDYTSPGYEAYGRYLVDELVPWIDANYRTCRRPEQTAVIGSSLGGVVSLYLAWQWPRVFGLAACMSSTFGWADDLMRRISVERRRRLRIYLDSGWPRDNYEVNRLMRELLLHRGYVLGRDLLYLAFPQAPHDETAWSTRLHLPLQFLFGPAAAPPSLRSGLRASEKNRTVLFPASSS
ncbi:MAG TPA: alpha/beta hydrolase-fold protein [Candidatus Polarisedimenticolaceae bacterium]|nr:alpha/beta hydrolase-fold protein [Candidatus Polarisedimenticolaceae bacterium]